VGKRQICLSVKARRSYYQCALNDQSIMLQAHTSFARDISKHSFHAYAEHGTILWKLQNQTLLKFRSNNNAGRFLNGFKSQ
jgi:hypothetical protein